MRKGLVVLAGIAAAIVPLVAARADTPTPEPNFAAPVLPGRGCTPQAGNPYERAIYRAEGWKGPSYARYAGACQRLKFAFGPLTIKPGQNDVLVQPITVEKPSQNGYIVRFRPDLVRADGTVPPIEQIHLHHGTWLSEPSYGSGPFFASGEEKTIAPFPKGYGLPVKATDQWQMLYMIHSAVAKPDVVYITYDIDFIPEAAGKRLGIRPAYPIWLDVRPSGYPVFNVQRSFGDGLSCTWPRQMCATLDPWGQQITGQGKPGNGRGEDWAFPEKGGSVGSITNFTGGTLIAIGGHLHPGGLTNDIDLVRNGKATRIYTGVAHYWSRTNPNVAGGPPTSWDFSMGVTGLPRWAITVKPEDVLRSNATYDTSIQASYENMGISVALFAPNDAHGRPTAKGLNPFTARRDTSFECQSGFSASRSIGLARGELCDKGVPTHGHLPESGNFGGASGTLPTKVGPAITDIPIAGFTYLQSDLGQLATTGIPTVKMGQSLRFINLDAAADVYHTITACGFPCTGATGTSFPIANGRSSLGRAFDFDSAELGVGPPFIGPAKNAVDWTLPITPENGFQPGAIVTYYCRIHPFMRGAVQVQK